MYPRLHSTKFAVFAFIFSLALHAMIGVTVYLLNERHELSLPLPVDIVNLPPDVTKRLPPLRPVPAPPVRPAVPPPMPREVVPERRLPPGAVPKPKRFGTGEDITLPKTGGSPRTGITEGAEQGKETGRESGKSVPDRAGKQSGPLPFLSQNDIDQLARKGMPQRKAGDDSVTLDTDEFKFISYNRWLKIKVESVLKYPELAAISGYQGALYIKFDILKDGSLGGFQILKSSGYKILDDEAERAIRASAPFQPLPREWNMDRYSIRAAVVFYLGEGYLR